MRLKYLVSRVLCRLVAGARLQELPIYTQSHFRWSLSDWRYPFGMSVFPESRSSGFSLKLARRFGAVWLECFSGIGFRKKLGLMKVGRKVFDHAAADTYHVIIPKRVPNRVLLDLATIHESTVFAPEIYEFDTLR